MSGVKWLWDLVLCSMGCGEGAVGAGAFGSDQNRATVVSRVWT